MSCRFLFWFIFVLLNNVGECGNVYHVAMLVQSFPV